MVMKDTWTHYEMEDPKTNDGRLYCRFYDRGGVIDRTQMVRIDLTEILLEAMNFYP